jgi:putative tricarboxylic transport membrane protein
VGYVAKKLDWPTTPIILGFILGPMLEAALRPTLTLSGGSIFILFSRPISLGFILLTLLLVAFRFYLRRVEKRG